MTEMSKTDQELVNQVVEEAKKGVTELTALETIEQLRRIEDFAISLLIRYEDMNREAAENVVARIAKGEGTHSS